MNDELEFKTYLSISPDKFEIYLLDKKNIKNLYKQKLKLKKTSDTIDLNILSQFLEDNVFKIEKLIGKFIKNISIIIDIKTILNVDLSIKKKNYSGNISKVFLENILTDTKDLFKENYQENKLMHMMVNKYLANGKNYSIFEDNINTNEICIEVKLICISNIITFEINKVLKKYQIQIDSYLDKNYILDFFKENDIELSVMAYKIQNGINENEVEIISKKPKKIGIFEKFFQLFS